MYNLINPLLISVVHDVAFLNLLRESGLGQELICFGSALFLRLVQCIGVPEFLESGSSVLRGMSLMPL